MISLQQSNILEVLAEGLATRLGNAESDPLSPQQIVVPNPGMGRWLSHYLATRNGVVANLELLTPGPFFWRVLRAWLPGQEQSLFDSSSLLWRIHSKLPGLLEKPAFSELKHYINSTDPGLRLFQLCQRIADSFDQYLVYRPEMVLAWEDGEDSHWQALLWRSLTEAENKHRARLLQQLAIAMQQSPRQSEYLPERVSFFGLNALAPVYMGILKLLGQHLDISISHLNLSVDYWADIRSEKSQLRRARAFAEDGDPFAAFLDLGNPLLASMGHIGQAYLDQLLELDATAEDDFREPLATGMLHAVQKDILNLQDGRASKREFIEEPWPSIQLHGTHTPWREVQVLHNNLLRCFDAIEDLKPREILVMAPNMAAYVPLIEAVFENAEKTQKIPFSIADRTHGTDSALAEAVRYLLKLPESRLSANDVLALLEVKALQQQFGFETQDLQRVRCWVHESGIRWAADSAHRVDLGLPGDDGLHSWQFGLQRLFLGIVSPVDAEELMYSSRVPYLDVESNELQIIAALQSLLARLDYWRKALVVDRSLEHWRADLLRMFAQFFGQGNDEDSDLFRLLSGSLDQCLNEAEQGGFNSKLSLSVVRQLLNESLDDASNATGFLHGGVTFSNLIPMRSLPFRVIYMLGMNEADFPRRQPVNAFDLMRENPQRGDRSRRLDDRYIFLESVCSARDCLFISYQSRNVRTDKQSLPAETINELMSYLDACYPGASPALSEQLFTQHPLQPFNPGYFNPGQPELFSYDKSWAIQLGNTSTQAFYPGDEEVVLEVPDGIIDVRLDELIRFFKNPAAAYLRQQLGMRLPAEGDIIQDQEPFKLDYLEDWKLKADVLENQLSGQSEELAFKLYRGSGRLPHGLSAEIVSANTSKAVTKVYQKLAPLLAERPAVAPLPIDIIIGRYHLSGEIQPFNATGVIAYRVGKLRPVDRLSLWIQHLLVAISLPESGQSVILADNEIMYLKPLNATAAKKFLLILLDDYASGLQKPLPFFPKTSWACCNEDKNWRLKWLGSDYSGSPGEREDKAIAVLYRDRDPLDQEFQALACRVYQPLVDHQVEV